MAFIAPEMSLVASGVRSDGVSNGASRLRRSSVLRGFDFARFRPSRELVFIFEDSTSFNRNMARSRWKNASKLKLSGVLIGRLARFAIAMPE